MPGTRSISGRDVRRLLESAITERGPEEGRDWNNRHLEAALAKGELHARDFSIRELFESLVPDGPQILAAWFNNKRSGASSYDMSRVAVHEGASASAVGYSDFSHITGQIYFNAIIKNYENPAFVFSAEIPEVQTDIQDIERFAGITDIGDLNDNIAEGQDYPEYGVGENYIDTPMKRKRGGVLMVTKEAVMGDRTGILLDNASKLGYSLGYGVEQRAIDAVIDGSGNGLNASAYTGGHRYTWRGTSYQTYQSTTWTNVKTSNAFTDESAIDKLWQVIVAITDPFTGRPILPKQKHLCVTPQLAFQATRTLGQVEVRQTQPGYATTGGPIQTVSAPALAAMIPGLKLLSSQILAARMTANGSEPLTDWFLGDLSEAFRHLINWKITPQQLGAGAEADFKRDIVLQYKASMKDAFTTWEPRYMGRSAA